MMSQLSLVTIDSIVHDSSIVVSSLTCAKSVAAFKHSVNRLSPTDDTLMPTTVRDQKLNLLNLILNITTFLKLNDKNLIMEETHGIRVT